MLEGPTNPIPSHRITQKYESQITSFKFKVSALDISVRLVLAHSKVSTYKPNDSHSQEKTTV